MAVPSAYGIVRAFFAAATWGSLGIALIVRDPRWLLASGAFGTLWWTGDALFKWVLAPLGQFLVRLIHGDTNLPPANIRPTVDDTIRLLESHIEGNAARNVQIQAALRLSDLYRAVYQDEIRALSVLATVRAKFPDAEELKTN